MTEINTEANGHSLETRNDGVLINMLTQMGTAGDKSESTFVGKGTQLSKQKVEELFKVALIQRVCTALPKSAILKGWQLTLGAASNAKIIANFDKYQERLRVGEKFCAAQIQANIYGGAAIILVIDDGLEPTKPVDETKIKTIKALEVLDRYKIYPVLENGVNPLEPEFYHLILPGYFNERFKNLFPDQKAVANKVSASHASLSGGYSPRQHAHQSSNNYRIHSSRILRFDGVEYTPDMMEASEGWGGSVIDSIWEDWRDYKSGLKSVGAMINDFSLFIYKLKNLSELVKANNETLIRSRLQVLRLMTSVFGGIAIDAEGESVEYATRNFGGIDSIIDKLRDSFIGSAGIPHDKLFGESPSGLGATGESEEKNWAHEVSAFQAQSWYPKLRSLGTLIFKTKDGPTPNKEPDDWGIEFLPLIQQSETDVVSNRATLAQTDSTYLSSNVLTADEIRNSRFGGSKFSIETVLDQKAWKELKDKQEQEEQFGGFDDFGAEDTPADSDVEEVTEEEVSKEDSAYLKFEDINFDSSDAEYEIENYVGREDARWKAGFTWVKDLSVKGNGYWRKNRPLARPPTATVRKERERRTRITAKAAKTIEAATDVADVRHGKHPTTNQQFTRSRAEEFGLSTRPIIRPDPEKGETRGFKVVRGNKEYQPDLTESANMGTPTQHIFAYTGGAVTSVSRGGTRAFGKVDVDGTDEAIESAAPNTKNWVAHLYGKKGNWDWTLGERETANTSSGGGKEFTPAIISVSPNLSGDHFYALEFDTGETKSKISYFQRRKSEPRNMFGAEGQLVLGTPVGVMKTKKGNEHPVYDRIQVQPRMSEKDPHIVRTKQTVENKVTKSDSTTPVKRVVNWQDLSIGITHNSGDRRFPGLSSVPIQPGVAYGHIRRSYGAAPDKKSLDVYYSSDNSDRLFKIRQLDPNSGFIDEPKYAAGFNTIEDARDAYLIHAGRDRFGGIESVPLTELAHYQAQKYHQDSCGCEKCVLVHQRRKRRRKPRRSTATAESTSKNDASDPDLADLITEKVVSETTPAVNNWLDSIAKWLDKVESLADGRDRISELFDQLGGDDFATQLMQKRIIADLGGRLEVLEEAEIDEE